MMKQSKEAFWWSLFSAGGVLSALCIPALIIGTGLLLPRSGPDAAIQQEQLHGIASFWIVRIALFVLIAFTLIHCAHRIRHVLMDVGLRSAGPVLSLGCYGGALLGTVVAGWVLLGL